MPDVKFSEFPAAIIVNGAEDIVGLQGGVNKKIDLDLVKAFVRNWKEFQATISQTGTGAPTIDVSFLNEFGAIVWARSSAGLYSGTLVGAFAGTFPTVYGTIAGQTAGTFRIGKNSSDVILLETSSADLRNAGAYADSKLTTEVISFRCYNV